MDGCRLAAQLGRLQIGDQIEAALSAVPTEEPSLIHRFFLR